MTLKRTVRLSARRLSLYLPFVWLAALAIGYTILHHPGHPRLFPGVTQSPQAFDFAQMLDALFRLALTLSSVGMLTVVAAGLGQLILRDTVQFNELESTSFQLLLGLGLLSLLGLLLGLLGLYPPQWLGWALLVVSAALLHRYFLAWGRALSTGYRKVLDKKQPRYIRVMQWVSAGLLLLTSLVALMPPTKWDSLTYHLAGPEAYLAAGRVLPIAENHFLGFPQLIETLFLWQLLLSTSQAAVLMHAVVGLVMLLLVLGTAQRLHNVSAGWVGVTLLLLSETIWASFHWPYNDLGLMAFTTASFLLLLHWGRSQFDDKHLIWAGVFLGFAVGCKYTAGGVSLGLALLAFWLSRRQGVLFAIRATAVLAIVAIIVFSPWMLKNFVLYQNPIAPFGAGTVAFTELDQWYYLRPWTGFIDRSGSFDWVGFFFAPMQFSIFAYEGTSPYMANITPLIVGLLPLFAVGWKQRTENVKQFVGLFFVFALPAYLFWLYGSTVSWYLIQTRLLFGIFPMLALLAGLALTGLDSIQVSVNLKPPVVAIVLLMTGVSLVNSVLEFLEHNPMYYVAGLQSEEEYLLASGIGSHYFALQQVNDLPPGTVVQFLWEPRTFYCTDHVACLTDSLINEWWHARQTIEDPVAIPESWANNGASYVLVFEAGREFLWTEEEYEPVTLADMDAFDSLRDTVLAEVWRLEGEYTLYEIDQQALNP